MASFKKAPAHKFSRVKNDLAELQRWWPVHIKDDGVLGISCDPVLYRTNFGTFDVDTSKDESQIAGIRVEAIQDDGSDVTGTEPTIVISGSGTMNPRCTINHADGTSTVIMLIARTRYTDFSGSDLANEGILNDNVTQGDGAWNNITGTEYAWGTSVGGTHAGPTTRQGPYPVFMTVQELVELIDTYRHIGDVDTEKKAWQPHKAGGAPAIDADDRVSSDPLPSDSPYRATVFMPMMLDNNQFSKNIAGSSTIYTVSNASYTPEIQYTKNGITRYDSDPEGDDASTIVWKRVGESGDHQENITRIANASQPSSLAEQTAGDVPMPMVAAYTSFDSTEAPPPKYRMAMALACFLKDGTYSLNNGAIIPYIYDAARTFGGKNSDTMYLRWNSEDGYGDATSLVHKTAGVYPFFDFVQGPITPRAQGSNWTHAVLADHFRGVNPLRYEVPPNAQRVRIRRIEVGFDADSDLVMEVTIDKPLAGSATAVDGPYVGANAVFHDFRVGQAIYIEDLDGVLGSDADMSMESGQIWDSRYDKRRGTEDTAGHTGNTGNKDCNGWWIVSKLGTYDISASPHPTQSYIFHINNFSLITTAGYTPTTGTVCAGRMGGPETKFTGAFYRDTGSNTPTDVPLEDRTQDDGAGGADTWPYNTGLGVVLNEDMPMNTALPKPQFGDKNTSRPSVASIGTGFQAGMGQGDLNVPVAGSRNDTGPARPTLGERAVLTEEGEYIGSRPVPRSISIATIGVTPKEVIASAPTQVASDNGSLRIPAPLGHDLCVRYAQTSEVWNQAGVGSDTPYNLAGTKWMFRSDLSMGSRQMVSQTPVGSNGYQGADWWNNKIAVGGEDKWAWRGVSTPLWSFIDGNTGRHAWDYIKPSGSTATWTYGRNRCWPAHERMGTRLAMTPSLNPELDTAFADATTQFADSMTMFGVAGSTANLVPAKQETTKIGLSEIGCSPIYLDMEMTAFIPSKANRMTIVEFDMNESDALLGRHHMIYGLPNRDMGFGFRPNWDGLSKAGVFTKNANQWTTKEGDEITVTAASVLAGSNHVMKDVLDTANHDPPAVAGYNANFFGFSVDASYANWINQKSTDALNGVFDVNLPNAPFPSTAFANRPAVWFAGGGVSHFQQETVGTTSETYTIPSQAGFGRMGTGFGYGDAFSYSEGINTFRAIFTAGGMTLDFNGETIGTDNSAQDPVWGFQIKACNVFAMTDRRPHAIGGHEDRILQAYAHLESEEPMTANRGNRLDPTEPKPLYTPIDRARSSNEGNVVDTGTPTDLWSNTAATLGGEVWPPQLNPRPTQQVDSIGKMTRPDNPAVQASNVDLQVDEIILRHIPTPAMLPFTVDTLKQQATGIASGLARYTSLLIEADNIDTSKGMKVTVTLLEPPTISTIAQEASTVITGFDNLDPDFLGGVGEVDLSGLPQTAIDNGFVIRFNFFIPSSEDTDLHPIDWSKTPIIRSYQIFFDHKPTADNEIIGNTYDGSTATTVGTTTMQTFTTKVGHIVSMRLHGDTTDPDRKITHLKADMGDGTITEWLPIETPDANVTLDISHVYSSRPAGGTYDIKVYARDDNENDSDFVLTPNNFIRVTIIAAEPVAVVRAVPSMVRAGQAIRFDGSDSYAIDTGATITDYAWTFGDGSTGVNGAAVYQDHTYADAGEFLATLIVTDSAGSVSPVAKAVVKVLPATLVVPLTLSTKPSSFSRTRTATFTSTPILDAVYPEITDMGQRADEFTMTGMFLKETQETDIAFMEELLLSGALVEFEYQEVNYTGTADSKTFVGRMISFDYNREGGSIDKTPYTATFVREAGLGA